MTDAVQRWLKAKNIALQDYLRYSKLSKTAYVWVTFALAFFHRNRIARLKKLANSHRLATGANLFSPAENWLKPWVTDRQKCDIWRENRILWEGYGKVGVGGLLRKSLLVQLPSEDRKGVVMIWFEYDLITLLSIENLEGFLSEYRIAFFGSWSPPLFPVLWSIPEQFRKEVLMGMSHPCDRARLQSAGFKVEVLENLYMSSWQRPEDFSPRSPGEKDVDIVMVANWAKFKRHWVLFRGLRELGITDLKVVLIGQPESGRTVSHVKEEARLFGVEEQITFVDRLPVSEVWRWLERSRISLILSRVEGSCVVVAESLMAGTPVGMLKNAGIGSRAFINDQTGILLGSGKSFATDLKALLKQSEEMEPRKWAATEISAEKSLEVFQNALARGDDGAADGLKPFHLHAVLKYDNPDLGEEWSRELNRLENQFALQFQEKGSLL